MLPLLRKLFFWDAPAHGAFFGLTLLPVSVWLVFSVLCGILEFDYRLVQKGPVPALLITALFAVGAYCGILMLRMSVLYGRKTKFCWRRLWIPLAFVILSVGYGVVVQFRDEMHWKWVLGGAVALGCLLYDFPSNLSPWKETAGTIALVGASLVFVATFKFVFAYGPFLVCMLNDRSRINCMTGFIPFSDELHQWFRLSTAIGSFCFVALGVVLGITGYFLLTSHLADYAGVPLRKLFNGKIRCLWGLMVGSYVVFLAFALWETAAYHRAIGDLAVHFGYPMTVEELERQFYEGRPANPEFWKQLENSLKEYNDSQDEKERTFLFHPDIVLPKTIHARRKKVFTENAARQRLEQMLLLPIPPPQRNYADNQLLAAMPIPELSELRDLARMERQRILFALEDGDFEVASASLDRIEACREYIWKDHINLAYLMGIGVEYFYLQALERIIASGLPSDKWLAAQAARAAEVECQADKLEEHFLYGESVSQLNIFHWLAHYAVADSPCHAGLHVHSLRFLFPQGWWLAAHEIKGTARLLRIRHFAELPAERTGYILADMLYPAFDRFALSKQRLIASCRVIRGLIQAELHKRRTGAYPDSLEDLPQDPFSGQPLKYRKGTCEVVKEIYQEKAKEEKNGENDELFGASASSEMFVSQKRTIQAVQIWSVGSNGIDDGGICGGNAKKDDIRFIIPIP